MPRRRFPLRLHHADTALLLAAVMAATALCWAVFAVSRGGPRPGLAYTVETSGAKPSAEAVRRLLRAVQPADGSARVNAVRSGGDLSIGVRVEGGSEGRLEAKRLAGRIANRLQDPKFWKPTGDQREAAARELYSVDVLIRDAAAAPGAGDRSEQQRLDAALEVSRLLRRRSELLAQTRVDAPAVAPPEPTIVEHAIATAAPPTAPLALACMGAVLVAAVTRMWWGRRRCRADPRQSFGAPPLLLRPPTGLRFESVRRAKPEAA